MLTTLRPREKATLFGLENTLDYELVSILLGSGTKQKSVETIAKEIIARHPVTTWQNTTLNDFSQIGGCGAIKSQQILACIELGRRVFMPPIPPTILSSADVYAQVINLVQKNREEVVCLYLNARNELIKKNTVAIGGLNYSNIHPRDIFAPALALPCARIVLVHNHPSGNTQPSEEDIQVTKTIQAAGILLGIELLDHMIIGGSGSGSNAHPTQRYTSLSEIGVLSD